MAFDEQYRSVVSAVAEKQLNAGNWPAVAMRFPRDGVTQFEWNGAPPTDAELNDACAAFVAAGGVAAYEVEQQCKQAEELLNDAGPTLRLLRACVIELLAEIMRLRNQQLARTLAQVKEAISKRARSSGPDPD